MEVPSSDPKSKSSTQADAIATCRLETMQPETSTSTHPIRSPFPQSSFSGLGSLFVQGRSNEVHPTFLREQPQAARSSSSPNIPPTAEHPILPRSTATVVTRSHQQHPHWRRQESLLRPLTRPADPRPAARATTSGTAIWQRRDSHDDIAAQQGILSFCFFTPTPDQNCSA